MLTAQEIREPTPIQQESIPVLLEGRDLVGQAYTGSGKTLAFGLPIIERCDQRTPGVQCLILVPTRELALQVGGVMAQLAAPAGLDMAVIYGGVGLEPQVTALRKGVQIVVGTPGRVLDHLHRGSLVLRTLRIFILDEADQMLDQGFAPDVERIIATTPRSRQTALFSATTPDWVLKVAARHLNEPVFVQTEPEETEPDIQHSVIEAWSGDKMPVLLGLLDLPTAGSTLVFGRTRYGVMNLARRLRQKGYEVEAIQGDLGQATREKIMQRFRSGHLPVLLATNVAARGLDVLHIERVINYDLPESSELFVHRVGRTGRMGRSGQAITIIAATDLQKMQEIERHLGRKLPRVTVAQIAAQAASLPPIAMEADVDVAPIQPAAVAGLEVRKRRRRRRPIEAAQSAVS